LFRVPPHKAKGAPSDGAPQCRIIGAYVVDSINVDIPA